MTDEHEQHDESILPEDAVEDLAPEDADQEASGGAVDAFTGLASDKDDWDKH